MQLATTEHDVVDPCVAWQTANGATWCQRLAATITASVCDENKQRSAKPYSGDLRCQGCGGLDNQTDFHPHNPIPDKPLVADESADAHIDGLDALDDLIDSLYENPSPGDNDLEYFELDLDEDELLALFPELAGKETVIQSFSEYQTAAPRRAVYRGKCQRCNGYMDNFREEQDDNVFRCLSCGWRTSPAYERNRAIFAAGGRIV